MRALLAAACLTLLAGCAAPGTDRTDVAPVAPQAGAVPVEVSAAAGEKSVDDGADGGDSLGASCTGPVGLQVAYPAGWAVNPGDVVPACTMFSPDAFTVPPHTDARVAAVVLTVSDLPFDDVAAATPDEVTRTDEVVDGRSAVRAEVVAGPGLWPEGTPATRWVVDLGDRTLVADAVGLPPFDHERDVEVLDAMMRELSVDTSL